MKTSAVAALLPLVLLVVLFLIAPTCLLVLAYASPPDPTWIPGIYDDGDFDDIVTLITSATASVAPVMVFASRPMTPSVEALALVHNGNSAPSRSSSSPRAPPAVRPASIG